MELKDALVKARDTLNSDALTSEAQVRSAVIAPLLNVLGWDPADPKQWLVEYAVGQGNVDDALFGPTGAALVFVEAKRQGNLSAKAEDQLFGYANNKGVPLLVLTDGNVWDLYLSMAAGEPTERRFCHHEIKASRDLAAMAADMQRYLSREEVVRGQAKANAEKRLADILNREQGRKALPVAWNTLLAEPDELLRDLLIESAEQATGSRPWREDAEAFLRQSSVAPDASTQYSDVITWLRAAPADLTSGMKSAVTKWLKLLGDFSVGPKPKPTKPRGSTSVLGNLRGFHIHGQTHEANSGREAMTLPASVLEQRNPGFLDAWAASGHQNAKWPRAVRNGNSRLQTDVGKREYRSVEGFPDWFLWVHASTANKLKRMQRMTELAGLAWESDVEPIFEVPGV